MQDIFEQKLARDARRKQAVKYIFPLIIACFVLLTISQLILQLLPVSYLNKQSGQLTAITTRITSWRRGRGTSRSRPNYSLVLTLNNAQKFNIQDTLAKVKLGSALKLNAPVTIYCPTTTAKLLGAGFVREVSQVEQNGQVLYSWREQQKDARLLIAGFAIAAGIFYMLRRYFIGLSK
jgi:hypothetical protein